MPVITKCAPFCAFNANAMLRKAKIRDITYAK